MACNLVKHRDSITFTFAKAKITLLGFIYSTSY